MSERENLIKLCRFSREKAILALRLTENSLKRHVPYDASRNYSPEELDPYDAFCVRYIRAVETAIKFFRTWELLQFAENSETYRDLLHRMEKLKLISAAETWFEMREFRNRIVHDYLPEKLAEIYRLISGPYWHELSNLLARLDTLDIR